MSSALEALFSSSARVQILRLFLANPGSQFYQREIERETGQPIRAVQREVERLEGIGLLTRSTEGNRVFYSVNPGFFLLPELAALFEKAAGNTGARHAVPEEPVVPAAPWQRRQPFGWMETPPQLPLPESLRTRQVAGEWDRGY